MTGSNKKTRAHALQGAQILRAQNAGFADSRVELSLPDSKSAHVQTPSNTTVPDAYRMLVDSVLDYAIYSLDSAGNVVSWNAGSERATGFEANDVVGKHFSIFFPEKDRGRGQPARELEACSRDGNVWTQCWQLRKDGTSFFANIHMYASRTNDGQLSGFSRIVQDSTELKKKDALHKRTCVELRLAKRDAHESRIAQGKAGADSRAKSDFLANMSHELRTPLNAILGFSEVIKMEMFGSVGERYRDYASDIYDSGNYLLNLINDILDISKLEAGKFELFEEDIDVADLLHVCRQLIEHSAVQANVRLTSDVSNPGRRIRVDERRLSQCITNILSNAVKFTPPGGAIHITVADEPNGLAIIVRDTGIGISADDLPRAMDSFGQVPSQTSRKHKGTGLGLPIAKHLIELHGGSLTLQSEPSVGTSVRLTLPFSRIVQGSVDRQIRLHVVEDDDTVRDSLRVMLEAHGYDVSVYPSANSFLADTTEKTGCLITDIRMPGMSGLELHDVMAHRGITMPVIIITGHGDIALAVRAMRSGAYDFIEKPFDNDVLLNSVRHALDSFRADRSHSEKR